MGTFGWCETGQHDRCVREYDVFYIDPRGKVVYTGQTRKCECPKRGCKCYVPAKDRDKTTKRRRKQ
jgi:hypothetical protein